MRPDCFIRQKDEIRVPRKARNSILLQLQLIAGARGDNPDVLARMIGGPRRKLGQWPRKCRTHGGGGCRACFPQRYNREFQVQLFYANVAFGLSARVGCRHITVQSIPPRRSD